MQEFCGIFYKELKAWFEANQEPTYRAKQIFEWVYVKGVVRWDLMTNLGKDLRKKLENGFRLPTLLLKKTQDSEDKETTKFLWELSDKRQVESVLIRSDERRTVCVSSQVGCPARCAFCASGREGLIRNLTSAEIVEQVILINQYLIEQGERVTHIVFMGMGEPFENYEAVLKSIKIFIQKDGLALSTRRITVSTVGVIEGIEKLMEEDFKVNLVLSLHAPNQNIRKKVIPYARKYKLEDILIAMNRYGMKTKRDVTYEYTLLAGINDGPEQARELAILLKGKQCSVNLIPYNPVDGLKLKRPEKEVVERFRSILTGAGIQCTWRYTKGKDIAAACGQLALLKPV